MALNLAQSVPGGTGGNRTTSPGDLVRDLGMPPREHVLSSVEQVQHGTLGVSLAVTPIWRRLPLENSACLAMAGLD